MSMNKETALAFVYKCLLGDDSIVVKLRMNEGLDDELFIKLIESLRFLVDYYSGEENVPKRLALCMVDIYAAFSFREGFYSSSDAVRIEDAGTQLQELATDLFS